MSGADRGQLAGPTRLPGWVTGPMSRVYAWEADRRSRRFDRGIGVERIDRPVISIGNLSAGGTGKSPVVRWVIGVLREAGHRPAIAMRGYKASAGGMSDEQAEHAAMLPGVPIVAQPDRVAGLRALFETDAGASVDCVVLDDGFQHRRLARDLDIVLVDATRPPHRDALLPAGFLREPMAALFRADAVVLTRCGLVTDQALVKSVDALVPHLRHGVPVFGSEERWDRVERFGAEGCAEQCSPEQLRGARVVLCCGVGNPDALVRSVERAGVEIVERMVLHDHAAYDRSLVARLAQMGSECDGVLTTGKDWVKIQPLWANHSQVPPPVWVPRAEACVNRELRGGRGCPVRRST